MLHAIGDLLCSVGVLLAALIVYFYPQWQIVDPICTLVFGIVAISTTIGILRDIFRVLMQATPDHISLVAVRERIIKVNGVQGVDCKVWALSMGEHVASIQVTVGKSSDMYQLEWIIEQIEQLLRDEFDVTETTIETRMSRD